MLLRSECAWGLLPRDSPHWRAVYEYFRVWKKDDTWLEIHDYLHEELCGKMAREKQPWAAIVDSQSVKTTEKGGAEAMMEPRNSWSEKTNLRRYDRTGNSSRGSFGGNSRCCWCGNGF